MKRILEDSPVVGYQLFRYQDTRADGTQVVYPNFYVRHAGRTECLKTANLKEAKGKVKRPLYLRMRDGGLFGLAGLWEEWKSPDGTPLRTCTIITVDPNPLIASVHTRMAAILKPEDESAWLDGSLKDGLEALKLLRTYPEEKMELHQVSRKVNSPDYDAPDCIQSIDTPDLFRAADGD